MMRVVMGRAISLSRQPLSGAPFQRERLHLRVTTRRHHWGVQLWGPLQPTPPEPLVAMVRAEPRGQCDAQQNGLSCMLQTGHDGAHKDPHEYEDQGGDDG